MPLCSSFAAGEANHVLGEPARVWRSSASGNFDERGPDRGRLRDRLACIAKAVEMEVDRLSDQPFHLLLRVADHADAGEVGAIGAPGLPFVFDIPGIARTAG